MNEEFIRRMFFIKMPKEAFKSYDKFLEKVLGNESGVIDRLKNIDHLNKCLKLDIQKENQ